jgi:tetratricopeptide (TPR) repeat protein
MTMALLLALFLPLTQEDPHVTYREGLFEEVDQGNLEKAAELYGKVLKSGAPDALKAKALLRTGFCHEKKGKKKEAEQAWRDVIERYPGAAETVKLARERLETQTPPAGDSAQSMDSTIQSLVLDLGGSDPSREEAIRKLVLIADGAFPALRKAVHHRDGRLAVGAARVLIQLEAKDGLYEPLIAAFGRYSDPTGMDAGALSTLLGGQDELKAQFVKDAEKVSQGSLIGKLSWVLDAAHHPAFPKILEDWLVNPKVGGGDPQGTWSMAAGAWIRGSSEADLVRLVERLTASDLPQYSKLLMVLSRSVGSQKPPGKPFQTAVLSAFTRHAHPEEIFGEVSRHWWFPDLLKPADLISGPVSTWFSKGNPTFKKSIIASAVNTLQSVYRDLGNEFRKFLFARLGDKSESWEIRTAIDKALPIHPETPDEMDSAVSFGLDFIKEAEKSPDLRPGLRAVLYNLIVRMPPDSKDLPAVLDVAFDWVGGKESIDMKANRDALVAASFRAVKRKAKGIGLAITYIAKLGTAEEKLNMGPLLPDLVQDQTLVQAAWIYIQGLGSMKGEALEEAWKAFRKLYDSASYMLKAELAGGVASWPDARVDELMKEALKSDNERVRNAAITHWSLSTSENAIPLLIEALDDKSEYNRGTAIDGLGKRRALDAVPALIRFLEGAPENLRDRAAASLTLIRKHFEERAQWQRWYDETKKTLNK